MKTSMEPIGALVEEIERHITSGLPEGRPGKDGGPAINLLIRAAGMIVLLHEERELTAREGLRRLAHAHAGLLRALDLRIVTPDGRAVMDEVRMALQRSGYEGPLGLKGPDPARREKHDRAGKLALDYSRKLPMRQFSPHGDWGTDWIAVQEAFRACYEALLWAAPPGQK